MGRVRLQLVVRRANRARAPEPDRTLERRPDWTIQRAKTAVARERPRADGLSEPIRSERVHANAGRRSLADIERRDRGTDLGFRPGALDAKTGRPTRAGLGTCRAAVLGHIASKFRSRRFGRA